jgi:hypothetical protein
VCQITQYGICPPRDDRVPFQSSSLWGDPMSFRLQGPSLLLNSYAFTDLFGGCGMFMDTSWNCPSDTTVKNVVNWIGVASGQAPGKRLANVVLNFHGTPGVVYVGEITPEVFPGVGKGKYVPAKYNVIDNNNAGTFYALRDANIGTIWFHSCELAATQLGKKVCRQIAIAAHCKVVAAEETQTEWLAPLNVIFMPRGCIDDYEGQVYLWDSQGNMGKFDPNGGNWS